MIQLFDAASAKVRPLELAVEGQVSMYVCGPTVSGRPHVGHGRFALVFDVLRRYLLWSGLDVRYVSNITDIEDKIIDKANSEGVSIDEIVERYEKTWWQAIDALGVMRPTVTPYATQYVEHMIALIERLLANGSAYQLDDGVYFRPSAVADYGVLARQTIESLQSGARIDIDSDKESPIDFVLWKLSKDGEPSWPSPFGAGRPGWHTECVVMSLDLLGEGFDLHGGGLDLAFPHHENERAQAVADGCVFARHWVHNGFVEMGGEKMSKSIGNVMDLIDVVENHDPRAYRMLVLQAHYRSPLDVNPTTIARAEATLERLDALARRADAAGIAALTSDAEPNADLLAAFAAHMDDDLDTPGAMALVFSTVTEINRSLDAGDTDGARTDWVAVSAICEALGLVLDGGSVEVPEAVAALASARDVARAERNWAEADRLRNELESDGWIVEDSASGTTVRRG